MDARSRVDAELSAHRQLITNAFTQEELAGLRKKVQEQQHELGKLREQLKEQQHSWEQQHKIEVINYILCTNLLEYIICCIKMEVLTASIHSLTEEKGKLMQENKQLSESLADEIKSRSVYSVLLVRHVVSRRRQRNNLLGRIKKLLS